MRTSHSIPPRRGPHRSALPAIRAAETAPHCQDRGRMNPVLSRRVAAGVTEAMLLGRNESEGRDPKGLEGVAPSRTRSLAQTWLVRLAIARNVAFALPRFSNPWIAPRGTHTASPTPISVVSPSIVHVETPL